MFISQHRKSLMSHKCHMSQMSQFVSGCRGVVITGQRDPVTTKRETMALCAKNYGSFQLKVPQTLIAGTSFSDSGNVKRW